MQSELRSFFTRQDTLLTGLMLLCHIHGVTATVADCHVMCEPSALPRRKENMHREEARDYKLVSVIDRIKHLGLKDMIERSWTGISLPIRGFEAGWRHRAFVSIRSDFRCNWHRPLWVKLSRKIKVQKKSSDLHRDFSQKEATAVYTAVFCAAVAAASALQPEARSRLRWCSGNVCGLWNLWQTMAWSF